MARTDQLLAIVGQIYDAAADQNLWPGVLASMTQAVGGQSGALELRDYARLATNVTAWYNVPNIDEYQRHYGGPKNILIQRGAHLIVEGRMLTADMLCPAGDFLRSEFYNEFLHPQDMFHVMGGSVLQQESRSAIVSMTRPKTFRNFGAAEREFLQKLVPHLQRGMQIHLRMAQVQAERDNMASALDGLPFGVLFVDRQRQVTYANAAAQRVLAAKDGLSFRRGSVELQDLGAAAEYRRLLSGVLQTTQGQGLESGGALRVARPSGLRDYCLLVCPGSSRLGWVGQVAAVVFVSDPETRDETPAEMIARLFDLTPAEAKLVTALSAGGTLAEAAGKLEISRNTAHTQLNAIYQKTGTCRQTELLRLVLAMPAPRKR